MQFHLTQAAFGKEITKGETLLDVKNISGSEGMS